MQITSNEIFNIKYVQIYLTEEELKRKSTKEVIENCKKQKYKIGVFITGKKNYPEVLKKIVMKQVEVEQNVC